MLVDSFLNAAALKVANVSLYKIHPSLRGVSCYNFSMLSKEFRFHSRGGVKYTYRNGKTIRHPEMSLVFCDNKRGFTRFAVVVSKKVYKSAVARNRIRRRIYEAIRHDLDHFKKPRDYIFVVYSRKLKTAPFPDIQKLIRSLLEESMLQ